ncbi:class V chitinase CHIT5a [Ziziphus jujuba]|uniref:Class V chitinase CHIT5a n=1 Tax=Ziziphus jujuba TaxID=326968 RepID=A0A6P3ZXC1_ZIZJJ|nr:class V chitinase CHIT5a [Ziziphus jujuba]
MFNILAQSPNHMAGLNQYSLSFLSFLIFHSLIQNSLSISFSMPPLPATDPYPPTYEPAPIENPYFPKGIQAAYWPSFDGFPASSIDTSYFTHIYYAFLLPEPDTYRLNLTSFDQIKIPEFMDSLRTRNPPVATLLAIGGGNSNPVVFSKMVRGVSTRAVFINSTIEIARRYGFDGVDLDWEFPANDEDMTNLALLYQEWRNAIDAEAKNSGKPRLLLTSAVYFSSRFSSDEPRSYPAKAMAKYLDWVSPMCYDYHGSWENFTGAQSALYDPKSNISTSYGIGSWIQDGVPPEKIVMGLPLYGKTWKLQDPNLGVGPGDGILLYRQIVDFNNESKAVVVFDSQTVSYFSIAGDSWVGFEDMFSIRWKVQYAKSSGLGGYFFWALGQDKDWILSMHASNAWNN